MNKELNCKIPDPRGNFRKVVIPAAMGDDSGEFAPQNGAYHDALVKYEANGAIYIYSSDGIPTKINNYIEYLKALAFKDKADYNEDIVNKPEIPEKTSDLVNDSGFITNEYHDASKQDSLTAGNNITIENNVISAAGGGTLIEAGKGIEIEKYAPLSITMEVTGNLPPEFEEYLPLSISLTNVKPGTNMYDLLLEKRLTYEQIFFWDASYTMSTSGIDEDVISIAETEQGLYFIQFNGVGTTAGTITATSESGSYTANVAVTVTAGDNATYVSSGRYRLPIEVLTAVLEMQYGDEETDPEVLLEIFHGQDNVDAFIDAVNKKYEFYGASDEIEVIFRTLTLNGESISFFLMSDGDFDNAIVTIQFENGEISRLAKSKLIRIFDKDLDGLVPRPGYSQVDSKFLRGDGTWQTLNTYPLTLILEDNTTVTLNLKGE